MQMMAVHLVFPLQWMPAAVSMLSPAGPRSETGLHDLTATLQLPPQPSLAGAPSQPGVARKKAGARSHRAGAMAAAAATGDLPLSASMAEEEMEVDGEELGGLGALPGIPAGFSSAIQGLQFSAAAPQVGPLAYSAAHRRTSAAGFRG